MITKHSTCFTVMPQHSNYMSMVFGGEMLARMDICAAECVRRFLYSAKTKLYALTTRVEEVGFAVGAEIGDIVFFDAKIIYTGIKTIKVDIIGHREQPNGNIEKICTGKFTFVTKDDPKANKACPHGLKLETAFHIDEIYCPRCESFKDHSCYNSGHERDSSQDYYICLTCGEEH